MEIAVGAALLHRTYAAHAAIAFVAAALVQNDFTRRFFCTGEHAAHHDARCPGCNRFGDVAAVAYTAVGNQRHAAAVQSHGHVINRGDLRHADTGDNARGANRARANADLDRIRTGFSQCQRSRTRGDVAADHVNVRVVLFDPANPFDHAVAVTMCRIHHDGVNPGANQGFNALFGARAYAHSRTYAQTPCAVARCIRETGLLGDVFDGDQAFELESLVDHQQTFQLVFVQQRFGLLGRGAFRHGDEPLARRHDVFDLQVVARLETQIAVGDDADHFARVAHRETGNAEFVRQGHDLSHRVLRRDDDRIKHHTAFIALDFGHFGGLLKCCQVFVDDAHASLLGDGNGQTGFCDRVHGGGHQRQIQRNAA